MSLYKQFESDQERERNGIIVDYGDFRVTVARAGGGNKAYAKALEIATRPFKRAIAVGVMDNDKSLAILREVYADTVIRLWETKVDGTFQQGIEAKDGSIIPFNKENVVRILTDLPDLFLDIKEQAESFSLYRAELQDELGNG